MVVLYSLDINEFAERIRLTIWNKWKYRFTELHKDVFIILVGSELYNSILIYNKPRDSLEIFLMELEIEAS